MKNERIRFLRIALIAAVVALAACEGQPDTALPTRAVLPSATLAPRIVPSATPAPPSLPPVGVAEVPSLTVTPGETAAPPTATLPASLTPTVTASASATVTRFASATPTPTRTASATITLTPSLTITNTITPIPSATYTPSPELGLLGELVSLSAGATILPPEQLYNPPTLTALFFAGQNFAATQAAAGTVGPGQPGTPGSGGGSCAIPVPPILNGQAGLGCPLVGAPFPTVTGAQNFERGAMIFVQGPPNLIVVLTPDGRFTRYPDTWTQGVDPESLPDQPPPGLVTPRRGFGKVWSQFPEVRALLGFATADESGSTGAQMQFERGRAISVPVRGEVIVLIDDAGGLTGTWRAIPGGL